MSTRVSASNLAQALQNLMADWNQTRSHWRDAKSQEFEKQYLEDLPGQIMQAKTIMEEIDVLLRKVRSDCE
jgi:hypothetical protein